MRLDWRRLILYITAVGMEGCWLYIMLEFLNKQTVDSRLSILAILLVYPVAFGLNALLRRLRWHRVYTRTISWFAWAVTTLLVVKFQLFVSLKWADPIWLLAVPRALAEVIYSFEPELLILLSTVVIWWLCRHLVYTDVNFNTLVTEFQFGLLMMLITFFLASMLDVKLARPVILIMLFFIFALLGTSVAHALEGKSWLSGLYQGHWSGLLLVSISLVLISGTLISLLVTPDLLQLLLLVLKWLWALILKVLAFIVSLFPEPEPGELPPPMPLPGGEPSEGFKLWTMPESVRNGLRIGWTVMMIGIVLLALWRLSSDIFSWLRRKLAGMAGAEYEPLPGAFSADLLGLLKRILSNFLGLKRLFWRKGKSQPGSPEVVSVRQLYRQFLRWAAAGGYPRHISQTPHEYLHTMTGLLPEAQTDLDTVTRHYVRTRYGAWLPTEGELFKLRECWRNIKRNRLRKTGGEYVQEASYG